MAKRARTSTYRADERLRRPQAGHRRRTLSTVYYSLPYLLAFGLHMGAVLWLVGVLGGSVAERTLMSAAFLLAALLLLIATPSGPRPNRHRRQPRRHHRRTATAVGRDDAGHGDRRWMAPGREWT
jgi:hypothetical protein